MSRGTSMRIEDIRVTPIAFADPPLLSVAGCHDRMALRSIIEVEIEGGTIGLGESYGASSILSALDVMRPQLIGRDVMDLNGLWRIARELVEEDATERRIGSAVAAFEVACLDAFGKHTGRRVCDLLGGQVRESVPFSAYLFYKFGRHHGAAEDDAWGEVLTPEAMVEEARRMVALHGFGALKLKAGILEPLAEIEALLALRDAFPKAPLRIDPNAAWHVHTSLKLLPRLEGVLEYLEDPTPDIAGMAVVQKATSLPLATNMCVIAFDHLPPAIAQGAVKVVLADHHYWGGLTASRDLARMCEVFGLGVSMHSNSHLGISLAAMAHLGAATANLGYDLDTHYPWQTDEVIEGGRLAFEGGALRLPVGPGLGVTLDRAELARLHRNYLQAGLTGRNDAVEMRKHWPDWRPMQPRY